METYKVETRKMKRKQVILGPSPLLSLDIDTYSRHRFLITSFNRITFSKPEGIGEGKRERESRQAFASSLNRMREVSRVCDSLRAFTRNRERNARSRASQFPPREWRDVESKEREKERKRKIRPLRIFMRGDYHVKRLA